MLKFTREQLLLAKSCQSTEELYNKMKEKGINVDLAVAEKLFASTRFEELSEDDVDIVSGGCGTEYCRCCGSPETLPIRNFSCETIGYRCTICGDITYYSMIV